MPPSREAPEERHLRLSPQFWLAVIGLVIGLTVPALMWGGRAETKLDSHAALLKEGEDDRRRIRQEVNEARKETRDDLREIHRKIDVLIQRAKP